MALISRFPVVFLILLLPAVSVGGSIARDAESSCSSSHPDAQLGGSDIDYPSINRLLLIDSHQQRLVGLPLEIKKLELSRAPEAVLVRHRLQLALAQSYAALNMIGPAILSLKGLPVSSPQAPEALLLLSELEVRNGRPKAAIRWLRQMAELYPEEALTVRGLWRAAELNHPHSRQALALWQQAAEQADIALSSAQNWHARSQKPDFLDTVNSERLSPELWRLSRTALTDPAFASADAVQAEVRRQLQCLTANQGAQLRRMEKNPRLLADLTETVETLSKHLTSARSRLTAIERQSLELDLKLRECGAQEPVCAETAAQQAANRRDQVSLKKQISELEKKLTFLHEEEKLLHSVAQDGGKAEIAVSLNSRLSSTKAFMQGLLQRSLASAVEDWEALSAEAHYRLAIAQQPRIQPGLAPPK